MENRYLRVEGGSLGVRRGFKRSSGVSMLELIVVVAITALTSVIAVPIIGSAMNSYQTRSAASSAASAVQSTRYRAIAAGYPYQVAYSAANSNYLIQSDPNATGAFNNIPSTENNGPGPFSLSGSSVQAKLVQDITLGFSPSGAVRGTTGGVTSNCPCTFTVTYKGTVETITVSLYGNVSITP
jgi:Tfp pilus assembly protein FimT